MAGIFLQRNRKFLSLSVMLVILLCGSYESFSVPDSAANISPSTQSPMVAKMLSHESDNYIHYRLKHIGVSNSVATKQTNFYFENINLYRFSLENHFMRLHTTLFFTNKSQPVLGILVL